MWQRRNVIVDRGSRYAVSAGGVVSAEDCAAFLENLKQNRKFDRATHNSWAAVLPDGQPLRADDGEAGAGEMILRMLLREGVRGQIVVVTRWYGGKHLGGDRFRHVQRCVRVWLEESAD